MAGRFSCTYDPVAAGVAAADVGLMEDGYEISVNHSKELINQTDGYGDTTIDGIYRGMGNVFIQSTALEWKAGMLNALFPYGATNLAASGATFLPLGVIGQLDSAVSGILIFTATAGTPAAAAPATMTATYAIIGEDAIRWTLTSKLRKTPIRWRILPYLDTIIKVLSAT